MLNTTDILETINMIREENLDIRTVTMGISLFDCVSDDIGRLETKIYDKITKKAERLVSVCEELEASYGVPIINKRVSVTPISLVGGAIGSDGYVRLAHTLQRAGYPWHQLYRRLWRACAEGNDSWCRESHRRHPRGAFYHLLRLLVGQCGKHQGGYQYGRGKAAG